MRIELGHGKLRNLNKVKKKIKVNLTAGRIFFLAGIKAQCDESGGRILLGDNTGGVAVLLRPIGFRCVVIWLEVGLRVLYLYN